MSVWTVEGQVDWVTVWWDMELRGWMTSCERDNRAYPLNKCASEKTAAHKALRDHYAAKRLKVKITATEQHKHYGKDLWDFKLTFNTKPM